MAEERALHEAKLAKMENEMKMVFQQKVNEKEAKLKQSEEELYARHREMKEALEKQRLELEDKKRRIEQGRPLTPEKVRLPFFLFFFCAFGLRRRRFGRAMWSTLTQKPFSVSRSSNNKQQRRRASCEHELRPTASLVAHTPLRPLVPPPLANPLA